MNILEITEKEKKSLKKVCLVIIVVILMIFVAKFALQKLKYYSYVNSTSGERVRDYRIFSSLQTVLDTYYEYYRANDFTSYTYSTENKISKNLFQKRAQNIWTISKHPYILKAYKLKDNLYRCEFTIKYVNGNTNGEPVEGEDTSDIENNVVIVNMNIDKKEFYIITEKINK